jgi:hypothetical protein
MTGFLGAAGLDPVFTTVDFILSGSRSIGCAVAEYAENNIIQPQIRAVKDMLFRPVINIFGIFWQYIITH